MLLQVSCCAFQTLGFGFKIRSYTHVKHSCCLSLFTMLLPGIVISPQQPFTALSLNPTPLRVNPTHLSLNPTPLPFNCTHMFPNPTALPLNPTHSFLVTRHLCPHTLHVKPTHYLSLKSEPNWQTKAPSNQSIFDPKPYICVSKPYNTVPVACVLSLYPTPVNLHPTSLHLYPTHLLLHFNVTCPGSVPALVMGRDCLCAECQEAVARRVIRQPNKRGPGSKQSNLDISICSIAQKSIHLSK